LRRRGELSSLNTDHLFLSTTQSPLKTPAPNSDNRKRRNGQGRLVPWAPSANHFGGERKSDVTFLPGRGRTWPSMRPGSRAESGIPVFAAGLQCKYRSRRRSESRFQQHTVSAVDVNPVTDKVLAATGNQHVTAVLGELGSSEDSEEQSEFEKGGSLRGGTGACKVRMISCFVRTETRAVRL
jgi:hypothetical protein